MKSTESRAAREKTWTAEQLRAFLDATADDREYAAWLLFATTGMRRGELCGLTWDNVDLEAGKLHVCLTITVVDGKPVRKATPKTGSGERDVALDPETVAALRAHKARQLTERLAVGPGWQDGGLVFANPDGSPLHPNRLSYRFRYACRLAGLEHIGLHGLRHTYVTLALRAGVSPEVVQRRVGHSNVAITLGTYSHVRVQDDRDAATIAASAILG